MCFSETASFTAAAVLSLQGSLSLNLVKKEKAFLLLGMVPLLFAVQQFSEGIIWHYFNHQLPLEGAGLMAVYIFLTFAFLVWPIFIPLALYKAESIKTKKIILFLFVLGGIFWGLYLLLSVPYSDVTVAIKEHSIFYGLEYFSDRQVFILKWIYLGLLIIPIFISSLSSMYLFGLLTIITAFIANYFYRATFTSVWCFFAAILSFMLYFVIKKNLNQDDS